MNCNCIRVYTTMRPQFYHALYDYNSKAENPLYLFHGVWMDEDDIATYADVYAENEKIKNDFITDGTTSQPTPTFMRKTKRLKTILLQMRLTALTS